MDGQNAGDVSGWAGIVPNQINDFWSFGYPASGISVWGGDYPYYCYSPWYDGQYSAWTNADTKTYYDIGMGCTMTGGASGGPWFTYYNGSWNYVASVNSHCWNPDYPCKQYWSADMWGPYFTNDTLNLLAYAKTQ